MKIWGFVTALPKAGTMAGGTTFYHELCKAFIKAGHEVEIQTSPRLKRYHTQIIDGVKYSHATDPYNADIIFLHSAALMNNPDIKSFKQPVVYLMHSESDLIQRDLDSLSEKDVLVANSLALQEKVKDIPCQHFLLYPICNKIYREPARNTREYITLVGSSVVKNTRLFYDLAYYYPRETFLHIEGGYGHSRRAGTENTRFVGNTTNLKPLYLRTKILLVPSLSETYSLVAREAGLLGIPVIASDLPGIRENLGSAGIYANPRDINTFRKKMDFLLDKNNYDGAVRVIRNHCLREESKNDQRVADLVVLLDHLRKQ